MATYTYRLGVGVQIDTDFWQAYDRVHMDINMNQGEYQGNPDTDSEKSQAGTNLVIVILVLVIVVAGVKLLMSSNSAQAPAGETTAEATSTASTTEIAVPVKDDLVSVENIVTTNAPVMPIGTGEVAFSVLAKDAVAVRGIFVHNPARASEGDAAWIQVYDGYKAVPAGQSTLIFTVSLAAMQYDEVKVRTLNVATGIPDEITKMMLVTVSANKKSLITIEL
mgnify:FL=1